MGRLDAGIRTALLELGIFRRFGAGHVLMGEGEFTTHVILILTGYVKVTATTESGSKALLAFRTSGDVVGELGAINGTPRSATVTTGAPVTGNELNQVEFQDFLRSHPDAALAMAGMVGDRLRAANRRRLEFSGYKAKIRVARLLAELGRSFGQETQYGLRIGLALTQQELAELAAASGITVQKVLRELREAGLIATGYRQLTILQPDALEQVARFL